MIENQPDNDDDAHGADDDAYDNEDYAYEDADDVVDGSIFRAITLARGSEGTGVLPIDLEQRREHNDDGDSHGVKEYRPRGIPHAL